MQMIPLLLSSGDQEEEGQRSHCDSRECKERQEGAVLCMATAVCFSFP